MKILWVLHKRLDRLIAFIEDHLTGQSSLCWYCPGCGWPGHRRLPHWNGPWPTICHACYERFDIPITPPCMNCLT